MMASASPSGGERSRGGGNRAPAQGESWSSGTRSGPGREHRQLIEDANLFRAMFEHAPSGMALLSAEGRFLHVNREICSVLGYAEHRLRMMSIDEVSESETPIDWRSTRRQLADEGRPLSIEGWYRRPGDQSFLGALALSLLMAGPDHPAVFVARLDDLEERRSMEERLRHTALHDSMTNLPNRAFFDDRLQQAAGQIGRGSGYLAVLFIDLDRFKTVNDRFGHDAGDQVLRLVADRIRSCVRPQDTAARYGGDEFTVLLDGVSDVEEARRIARRIEEVVAEPMSIPMGDVSVGACIGMAIRPIDGVTAATLVSVADADMYRAKAGRSGRSAGR